MPGMIQEFCSNVEGVLSRKNLQVRLSSHPYNRIRFQIQAYSGSFRIPESTFRESTGPDRVARLILIHAITELCRLAEIDLGLNTIQNLTEKVLASPKTTLERLLGEDLL